MANDRTFSILISASEPKSGRGLSTAPARAVVALRSTCFQLSLNAIFFGWLANGSKHQIQCARFLEAS